MDKTLCDAWSIILASDIVTIRDALETLLIIQEENGAYDETGAEQTRVALAKINALIERNTKS